MTRNRSMCHVVLGTILTAALAAPVNAQQISEARIKELVQQAAARVAAGQTGQAPPAPAGQAAASKPTLRMTLDDAVKAALDHNLNIAVQRLNPEINDISISSLRSVYRPLLSSNLATQSQNTPANSTLAGSNVAGAAVETGLTTFNGSIGQAVPKYGGSFQLTMNNNKQTTSSLNSLYNPTYNTNWFFQYTQPLLKGFKTDSNRQSIEVAKVNRDISDVQLSSTITNTLSNVREAYWNYVFAVQSVEVARQSLELAEQLVQNNQIKVQVGTMAPLDVVQAQSQAATSRQALVAAQATMRTSELSLKTLLVSGTEDPLWNSTIDPIDRPDFRPEAVDVEAAVRNALSKRTDLTIAKKNLQANDVTVKYLRDQLLPQADFVANYGLVGLGGTELIKSGTGVNAGIAGTIPGGYADALSTLLGNNYPRWTVSLNLSYPLGLSSAEAVVARARVQQNQISAQVRQIELQVATDVTNAAVTVQSNIERVQASQVARSLAEQQLDAENKKFEVGMSTNYQVVQVQRDLATAQNNELQAILAYRNSVVELERLQQTTLQNLGITIVSSATK